MLDMKTKTVAVDMMDTVIGQYGKDGYNVCAVSPVLWDQVKGMTIDKIVVTHFIVTFKRPRPPRVIGHSHLPH